MCRIEEKVYVGRDGTRQTFEDSFPCHNARHGKLCSKVTRKRIEYVPKNPQISRDDASSPASNNPPTPPTGTGSYLVEHRRPSETGRRGSTKDGGRMINPHIIIEFGKKKDKATKYPATSSKASKRSSLGSTSINSSDIAIESPGSEASYTLRTGYPEGAVPPAHPSGYTTTAARPTSHRATSSASSFTASSQTPSLYATSEPEPDSPSLRQPARYPQTIVHNPPPGATSTFTPTFAPSSPTLTRPQAQAQGQAPLSPYRTVLISPRSSADNVGPDGLFPLDYSEFQARSDSSHASSNARSNDRSDAAPEIMARDAERARQRKLQAEADKKRHIKADHEMAKALQQEEEARQVRFELGRAEGRAQERAENQQAHHEQRRSELREEERQERQQRKREEEDRERAAKEAKKAKEKAERLEKEVKENERKLKEKEKRDNRPPTRDFTKRPTQSRRNSMTHQDLLEQQRLLAEESAQMNRERQAAEQRERDERAAFLREQQQQAQYYDPRGGDRYPVTNAGPGLGRRNSVSGRRGSVSSGTSVMRPANPRPPVAIIQNAPPSASIPPLNTAFPQSQYSTRPPSAHVQNAPPAAFSPPSTHATYPRPAPSARHSSYDHDNPFAQPSTRTSNTSQDDPFAQPSGHIHSDNPFAQAPTRPVAQVASRDPWAQDPREALPRSTAHNRQPSDDRPHTLRRRGEEVLDRAAAEKGKPRHHQHPREASHKAAGFEDDYEDSDDDENEEDRLAGYGPRLGMGKHGKKRH